MDLVCGYRKVQISSLPCNTAKLSSEREGQELKCNGNTHSPATWVGTMFAACEKNSKSANHMAVVRCIKPCRRAKDVLLKFKMSIRMGERNGREGLWPSWTRERVVDNTLSRCVQAQIARRLEKVKRKSETLLPGSWPCSREGQQGYRCAGMYSVDGVCARARAGGRACTLTSVRPVAGRDVLDVPIQVRKWHSHTPSHTQSITSFHWSDLYANPSNHFSCMSRSVLCLFS